MIKYAVSRRPRIMFVGINPHYGSYRRGVPFSNNKMFWYLLNRSGIIDESMDDLKRDESLRRIYKSRFAQTYNLNFTNIITRPSRTVAQLRKGEELPGRLRIARLISECRPKVVCFIGKITYMKFTGNSDFGFGWQKGIGGSRVYVMHFPIRGMASIRLRELREVGRAAGILGR
ncbi:MAG: mismatch-specific DNA-glycosylase [Candidatus Micrarchaeota archaeon]|nr:mismatch-specific DNA-glycosylase [Candidatus Micrarchaeota archaeon]